MRLPSRHVIALAGLLVLGSNAAIAQETYLPAKGNEVVIYTHRFNYEVQPDAVFVATHLITQRIHTQAEK